MDQYSRAETMDDTQRAGRLTHLVEEHHARLYRYAFRLTGSVTDAEDLTQEFFAKGLPHAGVLIVPWTVPPDNFRLVAKNIAQYVKRVGDSPSEYLFDFV